MKLTIIPFDGLVVIDGVAKNHIDLSFMSNIHAVQWYDTWGEVERREPGKPPVNERITSLTPFQAAIDAWQVAKKPDEPQIPEVQ